METTPFLLERESGGNPWVHAAILEREEAVDKIVQRNQDFGLAESLKDDPLWDNYRQASLQAELRKQLAGIGDPPPVLNR
jgi:hypothetical protein